MSPRLLKDYLFRAEKRIQALHFYLKIEDYPDVIREAQEVVELLLKALILHAGLDVPKVHDVGKFIKSNLHLFPDLIQKHIDEIVKISRDLRKERELAFYGMEDWIPSEEYSAADASTAIQSAQRIYGLVEKVFANL